MNPTHTLRNRASALLLVTHLTALTPIVLAETPEEIANTLTTCVSSALEDTALSSREAVYARCEAERTAFLNAADDSLRDYMIERMDQYIDHVLASRES